MERVISYIDGFNLYFGLKSSGLRRYYWLNLRLLCENLLKPDQQLIHTKYFTARVVKPADKQKRQATFIEALETLDNLSIFFGKYQLNPATCNRCGVQTLNPNEKMTDVNIAVELLADAFQDKYDTAFLVSADSDLVAPVRMVKKLFPKKRIVAAFPPNRSSKELQKIAHAYFVIGREKLARSVFPPQVAKSDGFVLRCPDSWR